VALELFINWDNGVWNKIGQFIGGVKPNAGTRILEQWKQRQAFLPPPTLQFPGDGEQALEGSVPVLLQRPAIQEVPMVFHGFTKKLPQVIDVKVAILLASHQSRIGMTAARIFGE
jgi:hypothetical protein